MRTLARFFAGLYPRQWRARYGREFDALLEDVNLTWRAINWAFPAEHQDGLRDHYRSGMQAGHTPDQIHQQIVEEGTLQSWS